MMTEAHAELAALRHRIRSPAHHLTALKIDDYLL
jgi:hypothetical protein